MWEHYFPYCWVQVIHNDAVPRVPASSIQTESKQLIRNALILLAIMIFSQPY